MFLNEIVSQPNKYLAGLGLIEVWEQTTKVDRWVWFRKTLFTIDDLNIVFEMTFSLSIFFIPSNVEENFDYRFCKIISTKKDINFEGYLSDKENLYTSEAYLNMLTTNELKAFLLSAETLDSFSAY